MTLEEHIKSHAASQPDKLAVICASDSITYGNLWNRIVERSERLKQEGLKPARPYVYRASQDIDFIVTYCAVHYVGAIAVPIEQKAPQDVLDSVKAEVEGCTFSSDIMDILYTTGTTGKAKGVMLSSTCLESCSDNFICDLGFDSELCFIISGPLSHIASLFKMHPTLAAGGTVSVLDGLKDMAAFFAVFDLPFKKFATFLVPASIRLLLQFSFDKLASLADKIDFIETGAAPITTTDMATLAKALPKSRLYNTYGGTEIGCACTYNFNDGRYMEGCIGRPMKNTSVVVDEQGNVIVSGKTIMSGYVNDPENTAKVLVDGKIYGADLGYVDEEGMIHLKGRKGDVINVGGFKVDPVEVENAAAAYPAIKDCICVAGQNPVIGTVLKLLMVPKDGESIDKKDVALFLKGHLDPFKVPTLYEVVDKVQRTYNGKIDRKYYKSDNQR